MPCTARFDCALLHCSLDRSRGGAAARWVHCVAEPLPGGVALHMVTWDCTVDNFDMCQRTCRLGGAALRLPQQIHCCNDVPKVGLSSRSRQIGSAGAKGFERQKGDKKCEEGTGKRQMGGFTGECTDGRKKTRFQSSSMIKLGICWCHNTTTSYVQMRGKGVGGTRQAMLTGCCLAARPFASAAASASDAAAALLASLLALPCG